MEKVAEDMKIIHRKQVPQSAWKYMYFNVCSKRKKNVFLAAVQPALSRRYDVKSNLTDTSE